MELCLCSKAMAFSVPSIFPCNWASTGAAAVVVPVNAARGGKKKSLAVSATARFGALKGGAGVLERPSFDQSQFDVSPQAEEGGDIGSVRDRRGASSGDSYRVLLIDDVRHSENLVAKVVPKVVPSVSPDEARKKFHESREQGVAVVIVALKEHAEFYAQMLVRGGVKSAIEPDSNMA